VPEPVPELACVEPPEFDGGVPDVVELDSDEFDDEELGDELELFGEFWLFALEFVEAVFAPDPDPAVPAVTQGVPPGVVGVI